MRDAIARTLLWLLALLLWTRRTKPGRHSAEFFAEHSQPTPVSPWSEPWNLPTKQQAQELFRQQAETTLQLNLTQERRRAAALATMGVDYPYTYEGAPNAARNVLFEGRRIVAAGRAETLNACGAPVRRAHVPAQRGEAGSPRKGQTTQAGIPGL